MSIDKMVIQEYLEVNLWILWAVGWREGCWKLAGSPSGVRPSRRQSATPLSFDGQCMHIRWKWAGGGLVKVTQTCEAEKPTPFCDSRDRVGRCMIETNPTENSACTAPLLPCCKLLIPGSAFNSEPLTYLGVSCFWTIAQGFSAVSLAKLQTANLLAPKEESGICKMYVAAGLGLGVQVFVDFIHAQPPQSQVKPWRHGDAHRHNVTPSDHVSHQRNSSDLPSKNKCSQSTPTDQSDCKKNSHDIISNRPETGDGKCGYLQTLQSWTHSAPTLLHWWTSSNKKFLAIFFSTV